jgi:hypothetical protein
MENIHFLIILSLFDQLNEEGAFEFLYLLRSEERTSTTSCR